MCDELAPFLHYGETTVPQCEALTYVERDRAGGVLDATQCDELAVRPEIVGGVLPTTTADVLAYLCAEHCAELARTA